MKNKYFVIFRILPAVLQDKQKYEPWRYRLFGVVNIDLYDITSDKATNI